MTQPDPIKIQEKIPLAPFTTLKIGGPARFFARAEKEQHLFEAFEFAEINALQVFILGGGSNILVSDKGFDGLVIQVALKGVTVSEAGAAVTRAPLITAAAGEDWDRFVAYCVSEQLAGVECLSGIPGLIGGTPVQNVGAYGQEVSETIVNVRCFDRVEKKIVELTNYDCGFSYRKSIFNTTVPDRYVVLSVTYLLKRGSRPKVVYRDLKDLFAAHQPTLSETREAVLGIRRAKSMVIDETDPNSRSAGSFFKNPIVETTRIDSIKSAASVDAVPHFPVDDLSVKVPAAWLIEQAGFSKGFRLGNAGISTNHALALVNLGGARAEEIIALKGLIETKVLDRFGILLRPEPVFVGF